VAYPRVIDLWPDNQAVSPPLSLGARSDPSKHRQIELQTARRAV